MDFVIEEDKLIKCVGLRDSGDSEFDKIFKHLWREAVEAGACRYRLGNLQTKILPGRYRYVAQVISL